MSVALHRPMSHDEFLDAGGKRASILTDGVLHLAEVGISFPVADLYDGLDIAAA